MGIRPPKLEDKIKAIILKEAVRIGLAEDGSVKDYAALKERVRAQLQDLKSKGVIADFDIWGKFLELVFRDENGRLTSMCGEIPPRVTIGLGLVGYSTVSLNSPTLEQRWSSMMKQEQARNRLKSLVRDLAAVIRTLDLTNEEVESLLFVELIEGERR